MVLRSVLVGFWSVLGRILSPKIDQKVYRIPESVLGGGVEIKAPGGCQNVNFAK